MLVIPPGSPAQSARLRGHRSRTMRTPPRRRKAGDEVELRRPDGTRLKVASGLVLYNCDTYRLTNPEYEPPTAFYFHGLKKSDVPQGTELWQITEHKSKGEFKHWRFEKIEKEPGT